MGQIEWAMWANEHALLSAVVMFLGGIVGVAGMFNNWYFAAYAIVASLFIGAMEYPRGKRKAKGNTPQRCGQKAFTVVMSKLNKFSSNYYIRFILQLLLCVPCCFILPTIIGGLCLAISSFIYLVAAIKGEKWEPLGLEAEPVRKPGELPPRPPRPPPRLNQQTTSESVVSDNRV